MLVTRCDAIGQQMNVKAEIEKVMGRLIYANMRFKSTDHDLLQLTCFESVLEPCSPARTERGLLKVFEICGKHGTYFFDRASQSLRILLGDKYRSLKYLKTTDREGYPRREPFEVADNISKRFLDIDHQ